MPQIRNVSANVERLLWGISAGRCEFRGCNRVLYRHEVTGAKDNYAEKAHIYAVSPGGARFDIECDDFKNSIENLMLVCPDCHNTIDRNESIYTTAVLFDMKLKHEDRISSLTNIGEEIHSVMVYYTASIAGTHFSINDVDARSALVSFGRYPTSNSPINLGQIGNYIEDNAEEYFITNEVNLRRAVTSRVLDVVEEGSSIALFAMAPQPLLMLLGRLLNDKYNITVFQCHRREIDKWRWIDSDNRIQYRTSIPEDFSKDRKIALVFSLSALILDARIKSAIGEDVDIYSVTIDNPCRTFVNNPDTMEDFVAITRAVLEIIKQRYGKEPNLNVFPAMPSSLATRFGMDYMPNTDNPLSIYNEQKNGGFVFALKIGGNQQ